MRDGSRRRRQRLTELEQALVLLVLAFHSCLRCPKRVTGPCAVSHQRNAHVRIIVHQGQQRRVFGHLDGTLASGGSLYYWTLVQVRTRSGRTIAAGPPRTQPYLVLSYIPDFATLVNQAGFEPPPTGIRDRHDREVAGSSTSAHYLAKFMC